MQSFPQPQRDFLEVYKSTHGQDAGCKDGSQLGSGQMFSEVRCCASGSVYWPVIGPFKDYDDYILLGYFYRVAWWKLWQGQSAWFG